MKKITITVFVGIVCLGATSAFAQSKSERIAHLEGKVIALEAENAQNQRKLERVEHRADSLVGVNAELKVKLEMVNQQYVSLQAQYASLQAQNERNKAIGDSLNRVNTALQAQVIRAKAEAKKKAAAEKAAKAKAAEAAEIARAKAEEAAKAKADEAAAKAKADEVAALKAQIASMEQRYAVNQVREKAEKEARLRAQDYDVVANINKNLPWNYKHIRGYEIQSVFEDRGYYYVNQYPDCGFVWVYKFTISGKYVDRYFKEYPYTSGRRVNLDFNSIVK